MPIASRFLKVFTRHKVRWATALFLALVNGALFGLHALRSSEALDARFRAWAEERRVSADLVIDQSVGSLLVMAEMLAHDREIHALARGGRAAVAFEGGGPGGALAAEYRRALLERLAPSWRVAHDLHGVRQLHFHFGPGDLSFLRVHAPTQFGDRMDDLRPLVVDAIADGRRRGGFELGRIYAGLRGIVPIFDAPGVMRGEAIGAVEVGTSLAPVLQRLSEAAGGDYAIVLLGDRVDEAVFAEHRADAVSDDAHCRCVVEATTSPFIHKLTASMPLPFLEMPAADSFRTTRLDIPSAAGLPRTYEVAAWPMMDYLGQTTGSSAPGWVIAWQDATPMVAAHREGLIVAGLAASAAFLGLLIVTAVGTRFAIRALEQRVTAATAALSTANAALIDANATKSQFLATMSHEIRTPMNGVLGIAELLSNEDLSAKQARMLATIRSSGALLMTIITDILDVSKLDAGKLTLESIPFDLAAVAREVVDVQQAAAAKKGLQLWLVVTGAKTCRIGDPHRIAQVLHNLISNAIKFSDTGGVAIEIDAAEATGFTLSVTDRGIGMTAEQADRIFQPFEQADAATTRQHGGTGLRLSIVKGLVDRMGGNIQLETGPGLGTTFTIRLPLKTGEARSTRTRQLADSDALRGLRVLAVDDNEVNRMVLEAMLERLGISGAMAGSGAEALARFETDAPFDMVLLDIVMPEMDGPETRRRHAATAARLGRQEPPVIACTARVLHEEIEALRRDGFADHLSKPLDHAQLSRTLLRTLAAARCDASMA